MYENVYRIRVGAYRIICQVDDNQLLIDIGRIEHCGETTYRDIRRLF